MKRRTPGEPTRRERKPSPLLVVVALALGALGIGLLIKALFFPTDRVLGDGRPPVDLDRPRAGAPRLQESRAVDEAEAAAGGAIEGQVLDPGNNPVPGALVTLARFPPHPGMPSGTKGFTTAPLRGFVKTDAEGRFRFTGLVPAEHLLGALADGFLPTAGQAVTVKDEGTTRARLRLERGGVLLSGKVLDGGGGTVPGATLRVVSWPSGDTPGQRPAPCGPCTGICPMPS